VWKTHREKENAEKSGLFFDMAVCGVLKGDGVEGMIGFTRSVLPITRGR